MDEDRFLIEVYKESGEQVRNINALRNSFLGLYLIALAALFGLLAQQAIDGSGPVLSSRLWFVPAIASAVAAFQVIVTWDFIQQALSRQRLITRVILSPHTLEAINLGKLVPKVDRRTMWTPWPTTAWNWVSGSHRLDLFYLAFYLASAAVFMYRGINADPFNLTTS